jgi:hypothetical protein
MKQEQQMNNTGYFGNPAQSFVTYSGVTPNTQNRNVLN